MEIPILENYISSLLQGVNLDLGLGELLVYGHFTLIYYDNVYINQCQ
jgi:hypothetical protein